MNEPSVISELRKCKEQHSCYVSNGSSLDVQSVNVILVVYDKMSDEGKKRVLAKIEEEGIYKVAGVCWRCVT